MIDKKRGHCRVCHFHGRLRKDGTLFRHWSGFADTGGICSGWKQPPAGATVGP